MNETTEQDSSPTPESTAEPVNSETEIDEEKIFAPQNELPFPEQEIDLNQVFPEEENDLNDLFPDEETRQLLKKLQRNKKDLHTMTDRFAEEDWSGNGDGPSTSKEPTESTSKDSNEVDGDNPATSDPSNAQD
jgi:hypothetical protein